MARFFCFFIMCIFSTISQLVADTCSNCQEEAVFAHTVEGDEVCTLCGYVNAERAIAEGDLGEKKDFNADASMLGSKKSKSRIAGMYSAHQLTAIAVTDHEGSGELRKTQKFMQTNKEEKIRVMTADINSIVTTLHYGDTIKTTAYALAQYMENSRKTHARTGDKAMAAALILYALKLHQKTYSFKEMAEAVAINEKLVIRNFKNINQKLQNGDFTLPQQKPTVSSDQLPGLIESICGALFTDPTEKMSVLRAALPYIENFSSLLEGKSPRTIAATCVHRALEDRKSDILEKTLAEAANIAPGTLRNALKKTQNH